MVERINKVGPEHLRVDGAKDSLEEEGSGPESEPEDNEDQEKDQYDPHLEPRIFRPTGGAEQKPSSPTARNLDELLTGVEATEESTTVSPGDLTISQTLKVLHRTWWHKLGVKDPDTNAANLEISLAYMTVVVVGAALLFAIWLIMT